jgi:hypothetical protein
MAFVSPFVQTFTTALLQAAPTVALTATLTATTALAAPRGSATKFRADQGTFVPTKSSVKNSATETSDGATRKNICSITINSDNEIRTFEKIPGHQNFNFIELTSFADPNKKHEWFKAACSAQVKCDVLVISGHFGGTFFSEGQSDLSLSLNEMQRASCDNSCEGVFKDLQEVYLFGCNTLAGKAPDHRTPEQYARILIQDGQPESEAHAMAALRYGPFGATFKDQMTRVFEGAGAIHGFDSVAPSGRNIQAHLLRYLVSLGDYREYLGNPNWDADRGRSNLIWERQLSRFSATSTKGISKTDPGYGIKTNMCTLGDSKQTPESRVRHAGRVLREDPLIYLPSVATSFKELVRERPEENTKDIRAALSGLTSNTFGRNKIKELISSDGVMITQKVDLLDLAGRVGWLPRDEVDTRVTEIIDDLSADLKRSNLDALCAMATEEAYKGYFNTARLRSLTFDRVQDFEYANCMYFAKPDEVVVERMMRSLTRNGTVFSKSRAAFWTALWYLSATEVGDDQDKYELILPLTRTSLLPPSIGTRSRYANEVVTLAQVVPPERFDELIRFIDDPNNDQDADSVFRSLILNRRMTGAFLKKLVSDGRLKRFQLWDFYELIKKSDAPTQDIIAASVDEPDQFAEVGLAFQQTRVPILGLRLRDRFLKELLFSRHYTSRLHSAALLAKERLDRDALSRIYELYKREPDDFIQWTLRHVLLENKADVVFSDATIRTGLRRAFACEARREQVCGIQRTF